MGFSLALLSAVPVFIAFAPQSPEGNSAQSTQPAAPIAEPGKPTSKPAWPPFETPPQEMKDLAWLAGKWSVTTKYIGPDGKVHPGETEALIEPMLGGSFLREEITIPSFKLSMTGFRSFDRFRKVYRFIWLDNIMSLADIFEGTMRQGDVTVSNVKAGTSSIMPGAPENLLRFTQHPGADHDAFSLIWEASTDGGKTWRKTAEYEYRRQS